MAFTPTYWMSCEISSVNVILLLEGVAVMGAKVADFSCLIEGVLNMMDGHISWA